MKRFLLFALISFAMLFWSCETNHYFQSEKKLKSEIQRTWTLVRIPATEDAEEWTFSEGKIARLRFNASSGTLKSEASYSVSTTLSNAYLEIEGLPSLDQLDGKWNIIELNKDDLIIALKKGGSGVLEREFVPK